MRNLALAVTFAALAGCVCNPVDRCDDDATCTPGVCIDHFCVAAEGAEDAGEDAGEGPDAGADADVGTTDGGRADAGIRCPTTCTSICCEDGTAIERAAQSCLAILSLSDGGASSNAYWIDPDSRGPRAPVQLYCDMTGGGWTLIGKIDGQFDIYDHWLRRDVFPLDLSSPLITGGYACIDAVYMAVNAATEVRIANSDSTRWAKWRMHDRRTIDTWWRHDAGINAINAEPDAGVQVTLFNGAVGSCYQNPYGINPGGGHGGGFPSTYALSPDGTTFGWTYPGDLCMSVATLLTGTAADGFGQNGNGYDAPFNELSWPNPTYGQAPHVSVWLR